MDTTLLKGLHMLEMLALSDQPRGVSELARQLELPRSNVHRTLSTLEAAGFVRRAQGSTDYVCSLKLFELGSRVAERIDATAVARPRMRDLADATQETVHLAVLHGIEVVYLDIIESPQPVRAYSSVGGRAPAHCVASGKALLAELERGDIDARFTDDAFHRGTARAARTCKRLLAELDVIREQGFAVNRGEWRESVGGIAAVIRGAAGDSVAAIGISGPLDRIDVDSPALHRAVCSAARDASRELGGHPNA